jgi:hypothetical protein
MTQPSQSDSMHRRPISRDEAVRRQQEFVAYQNAHRQSQQQREQEWRRLSNDLMEYGRRTHEEKRMHESPRPLQLRPLQPRPSQETLMTEGISAPLPKQADDNDDGSPNQVLSVHATTKSVGNRQRPSEHWWTAVLEWTLKHEHFGWIAWVMMQLCLTLYVFSRPPRCPAALPLPPLSVAVLCQAAILIPLLTRAAWTGVLPNGMLLNSWHLGNAFSCSVYAIVNERQTQIWQLCSVR